MLRRAPNYSDAYFGIAQIEYWSGNAEQALKHTTQAIDLLPENISARLLKAKIEFEQGENANASVEVEEVLKRSPGLAEAEVMKEKINGVMKRK